MKTRLLVGICGSFCNHEKVLNEFERLKDEYDYSFVLTHNVATLNTRFGSAEEFKAKCKKLSAHPILTDLVEAEKIGPHNPYDIMVILPCSANTLSNLVHGAYNCPVALCAKAMIRNQKNVVIGISSNDILGISGTNLMKLINMKYFYTLPIYQDDPIVKPNSCTSDLSLLHETLQTALKNRQIQPILKEKL